MKARAGGCMRNTFMCLKICACVYTHACMWRGRENKCAHACDCVRVHVCGLVCAHVGMKKLRLLTDSISLPFVIEHATVPTARPFARRYRRLEILKDNI